MKTGFISFTSVIFLLITIQPYSLNRQGESEPPFLHNLKKINYNRADTTEPAKASTVVAPGATIKLIANNFGFTEGPAANKKGEVFFSDQPNDKIWKYSNDGKL